VAPQGVAVLSALSSAVTNNGVSSSSFSAVLPAIRSPFPDWNH